jgi:hypothetical protein
MPIRSEKASRPTVTEILADYAARAEGPMTAVYRLLEHVECEADLGRLFAQMPARLQQATVEMAVVYRDNFDDILECFGTGVDAHGIRAAFEKWARSRPEVVHAVLRPRGGRSIRERITNLEQQLLTAANDAERAALAAELKLLVGVARDDDDVIDPVTGLPSAEG